MATVLFTGFAVRTDPGHLPDAQLQCRVPLEKIIIPEPQVPSWEEVICIEDCPLIEV